MGMLSEFKEFIQRGNVVDMAVGVIIGASFGKIVNSAVGDVLMPPIGLATGGVDFTALKATIGGAPDAPVTINYGVFIQNAIDFLIIAFFVFLLVRMVNRLKSAPAEEQPPEPSAEQKLLGEIRDLLRQRA